jgi:hypothetical protein
MRFIEFATCALLVVLLGCQNSSDNPSPNARPTPKKEKIRQLDESLWTVTGKSCDNHSLALLGTERMQFGSGVLAYINRASADSISFCYQALVYNRVIQSFSTTPKEHKESSIIMPQQLRKVCRKTSNNEVISDETVDAPGNSEQMQIRYDNRDAVVTISGNSQCPQGFLVFKLAK